LGQNEEFVDLDAPSKTAISWRPFRRSRAGHATKHLTSKTRDLVLKMTGQHDGGPLRMGNDEVGPGRGSTLVVTVDRCQGHA
jgi:hypothetical protein